MIKTLTKINNSGIMNAMNDKEYKLDRDVYHLLKDEPFFALLSRCMDKRAVNDIPTAGMRYNPERLQYEIIYNPSFMKSLDSPVVKWVLMHELYHASLGHCQYRKLDGFSHKIANMAMDLAINSLPNMKINAPDFVLMPGRGDFKEITLFGCASEWYANQIQKMIENDPNQFADTQGQFDDHSDFGNENMSEEESMGKQIADTKLQDAIAKAQQACDFGVGEESQKGWGSISHETRKLIREAVQSRFRLDPKKVLASFIKSSVAASHKTSVTKRNRRLPGKKFGRKTTHRAKIAISIDQSGSVSDELLARVFDWLNEFAKFASFTVVPFDHEVFEEKVYVWKKGEKRKKERVLYGGTNFDAPTKFVNDRTFDGHIIVTDMQAPKPVRSNCQRIWLTDTYGDRYGM